MVFVLQIKIILKIVSSFLKQSVDQLHYQSIELVLTQNESQKMLINQMNPSLSIIRISSDKGEHGLSKQNDFKDYL